MCIVDDIGFSTTSRFISDSIICEAVDDAVDTSTTRWPGRPVIYYSAAGNDGSA